MRSATTAISALVLISAFACANESVEGPSTSSDLSASFSFMNGPLDLPNVFRGDSALIFAWADVTRDMAIVVNAPSGGVRELRRCVGPSGLRPEPQPVQTVGDLQDVLRQLRLWRDVNIHVYGPVPLEFFQPPAGALPLDAFCRLSPIAQGVGNLTSTDNDRLNTESSANTFGFRAQGLIDLAAGGSAEVTGVRQTVIRPDGTSDVLVSRVVLHPR
jgi:hypothetical protein